MSKNAKNQSKTVADFEIPFDGSLGLLAFGDIGVQLWREARKKKIEEMNNKLKENEQKKG